MYNSLLKIIHIFKIYDFRKYQFETELISVMNEFISGAFETVELQVQGKLLENFVKFPHNI